jgi:hypothetical protein
MNLLTICFLPLMVMKNLILILLLFGGFAVQAQEKEKQSLKDLLYGGKLKKDSTGVIRSSDDLSNKIDTSSKKEAPPVKTIAPAANAQQGKNVTTGVDTLTTQADSSVMSAVPTNTIPAKSNTKLWKEYTDSLVKTLNDEVLKAKQIKKNTYYLMVDYEIGTDGQVAVTNVTSTPESAFLEAQVRQIMDSTPLRLNPVTDSSNQPKKVKRKQQFTITKE